MRYQSAFCVAGGILLASCGGGTPGTAIQAPSIMTTPAPTPTPTPTPTPPSGQARPVAEIETDLRAAWAAIVAEIGNPTAGEAAQCGILPVGARACGGPESYIAYSRTVSNETRLLALAETHSRLSSERNQATGAISTCILMMPPSAQLVDGVCKTN
ncbi:MAG TPA: hypothetical protein VEC06_04370 [Paucimonas sp.]|nr:hypothetical protein [Paucimonas sp.]